LWICALVTFPYRSFGESIAQCSMIFAGSVMLAGCHLLVFGGSVSPSAGTFFVAALFGMAVVLGVFTLRQRRKITWEVDVYAELTGRQIKFRALIDTGNRLREPLSGLPVIVAEEHLLGEILQSGRPKMRTVRFGGVGGNGLLSCFKPDRLYISFGKGRSLAPDALIGVYPGHLPGSVQALAPPLFALEGGRAADIV